MCENKPMIKSKYDTPCKECIFAIYKDITQTSCRLNKIDLFHKHGIHVIEAYDEEKEFYVIRNKRCMWFRNHRWIHAKNNKSTQLNYLNKEIEIQYQAIIFANNVLPNTTSTLLSLLEQDIPPKHITIIRKPDSPILPSTFVDLLEINRDKIPGGYIWRVENIVDVNAPEGSMIDYVIDVKPYHYYSVFRAGFKVPHDTFSTLNKLIIEDLKSITILLPNSTDNGLIVSYPLHKILQGHHDCGIEHKLYNNDVVKVDKSQIQSITEICPNFPK